MGKWWGAVSCRSRTPELKARGEAIRTKRALHTAWVTQAEGGRWNRKKEIWIRRSNKNTPSRDGERHQGNAKIALHESSKERGAQSIRYLSQKW